MSINNKESSEGLLEADERQRTKQTDRDEQQASAERSGGKENNANTSVCELEQQQQNEDTNQLSEQSEVCFACKLTLSKSRELISVAGQAHKWHPECFTCSICCEPMDKCQSCHLYQEQILCRNDYIKLRRNQNQNQNRSLVKCARCGWTIGASDWVRRAANFVYHLACFNCDACFRQLNTGDQFTLDSRGSSLAHNVPARLLCRYHFPTGEQLRSKGQSAGASASRSQPEQGSAALNGSGEQHRRAHFRPTERSLFAGDRLGANQRTSQYVHSLERGRPGSPGQPDGLVNRGAAGRNISSDNMTSDCDQDRQNLQLPMIDPRKMATGTAMAPMVSPTSGNYIRMQLAGSVSDVPLMPAQQPNSSASSSGSLSSASASSSPASLSLPAATNTAMQTHSSLMMIHSGDGLSTGSAACLQSSSSGSSSSNKSKRVRTTFTDDQLSILQTHFHIDSNPDGQDLERIATITGLSKRVTQVWFQNSRARQKKRLYK